MAKIKINIDEKKISKRLKLRVGNALSKAEAGEVLKEEVIKQIQKGKDLEGNSLPPISKKWSDYRDKLASKNETDGEYQSGRSNLTFTGELLKKGLAGKFLTSRLRLTLKPKKGKHKLYKTLRKRKKRAKRSDYSDIFDGQAAQGRDVFAIGQKFLDNVSKRLIKIIKRNLR